MNWVDVPSPLGILRLTGEGECLTGVHFPEGRCRPNAWGTEGETPVLAEARRWLERYFAGEEPGPIPPIRPEGTAFQQAVWEILRSIPYGETMTYGAIAAALQSRGRRASAQAVGQAVGRNPVNILVPCHRVLGAKQAITGYGGGLWRKEFLLQLENINYK